MIKEISILEFEVIYLEKYLLSLYRKRFQEKTSVFSKMDESTKPGEATGNCNLSESQAHGISTKNENSMKLPQHLVYNPSKESGEFSERGTIMDPYMHRSHSSLSHRFDRSLEMTYHVGTQSEAVNPHHSLPLSMLEVTLRLV